MATLLLVAFLAWIVYQVVQGYLHGTARAFCPHCGSIGAPHRETRGSFAVELVLWLCFIVPGLLYSVWRVSNRYDICSTCGQSGLLPPDSPRALAESKRLSLT